MEYPNLDLFEERTITSEDISELFSEYFNDDSKEDNKDETNN